jgi:hypothetical protein
MTMQATHSASLLMEGTFRVIALLLCACSAAVLRYLLAQRGGGPIRGEHNQQPTLPLTASPIPGWTVIAPAAHIRLSVTVTFSTAT